MKIIPIVAAVLFGLSTTALAEPGKSKISHGSGKKIKSVLFSHRDNQSGQQIEKRVMTTDGTFVNPERVRGLTGIASSEGCIVKATVELQDGSTVEIQNVDICGLDELLVE
jgi:hypothetical protein